MNYNIYHKPELNIEPTLLAQTVILKTNKIKEILFKYYGSDDVQIINERKLFDEIIEETSKEQLEEFLKIGGDIYDLLLSPTQNFLNDISLALSMYQNVKNFSKKIPIEDLAIRKPVDNIPLHQFQRLPFIYAHSFLDAVVKIANTIYVMTKEDKTPYIPKEIRQKLKTLKMEFDNEFPHVKNIRHYWQHIEDRMRGKGQNEKKLGTKLLILSSLFGDDLFYTISDGTTHSIAITENTFRRVEYYVQKTFNSFEWIKGKRY